MRGVHCYRPDRPPQDAAKVKVQPQVLRWRLRARQPTAHNPWGGGRRGSLRHLCHRDPLAAAGGLRRRWSPPARCQANNHQDDGGEERQRLAHQVDVEEHGEGEAGAVPEHLPKQRRATVRQQQHCPHRVDGPLEVRRRRERESHRQRCIARGKGRSDCELRRLLAPERRRKASEEGRNEAARCSSHENAARTATRQLREDADQCIEGHPRVHIEGEDLLEDLVVREALRVDEVVHQEGLGGLELRPEDEDI
mmetsp:Transcript_18436/g.37568  ORF Transcript_18436/g.37568 Transcript_18436/m.37568 type:complete len:252 (-) Transcript_18436:97-852(-)